MGTAQGFLPVRTSIAVCFMGLLLVSCAAGNGAGSQTRLEIVIRDDGTEISQQYSLECDGEQATDASTLPDASKACLQLELEPSVITKEVDPTEICTEIYGGPQRAEVSGTLHGDRVTANFSRHNGCAINRWNSAAFLIGSGKS